MNVLHAAFAWILVAIVISASWNAYQIIKTTAPANESGSKVLVILFIGIATVAIGQELTLLWHYSTSIQYPPFAPFLLTANLVLLTGCVMTTVALAAKERGHQT